MNKTHEALTLSTKMTGRGRYARALYCVRCSCNRYDSPWCKTAKAAYAFHAKHVSSPHSSTCPHYCRECSEQSDSSDKRSTYQEQMAQGAAEQKHWTYQGLSVTPILSSRRFITGGWVVDIKVHDARSSLTHATVNAADVVEVLS